MYERVLTEQTGSVDDHRPSGGSAPDGRGGQIVASAPPELYFVVSAIFHYLGPSFAVLLFARVNASTRLPADRHPARGRAIGFAFAFANAALFSIYILLADRVAKHPRLRGIDGLASAMLIAVVVVTPIAGLALVVAGVGPHRPAGVPPELRAAPRPTRRRRSPPGSPGRGSP